MESISRTLGGNIAAMRKAKGLTQEQLVARVGVSAPAVSKWETGSSCPDIALLCPLARALDTNVDTLLQFEQSLSDKEVTDQINGILSRALQEGELDAVQQQLTELLHRYPNCTALQYNAAAAYDSFRLFFPTAAPSLQQEWKDRKRALLEQVRACGNAAYWQGATIGLAAMAMADGAPEQGAALLKELPSQAKDASSLWTLYYLKTDQPQQALELTQKQLYRAACQVISNLVTLTNPKVLPDAQRRRKVLAAYGAVAKAFGLPDSSDGLWLEWYLEQGDTKQAAACLVRFAETLFSPVRLPDPDLFAPGLPAQSGESPRASVQEMHRLAAKALTEEERYRPLWEFPACRDVLARLKESIAS